MSIPPPSFATFDRDSDGSVSEEEFNAFVAELRAARAVAGKPMKGLGIAPAFEDIDSDGDGNGCISAEEFAKHQAEMHST